MLTSFDRTVCTNLNLYMHMYSFMAHEEYLGGNPVHALALMKNESSYS